MRIITLSLALVIVSAAAPAQSYIHAYGGSNIATKRTISGFLMGGAFERGWFYAGADWHSLKPTSEARAKTERELQAVDLIGDLGGLGFLPQLSGLDASLGIAIPIGKTFSLIPVGIGGYTRVKVCIETSCFPLPGLNYGGGGSARVMLTPHLGLHAGVRYTRHYSLAFTVGAVFRPFVK